MISRRFVSAWLAAAALLAAGCGLVSPQAGGPPLRIVVMDPLSLPLSCECVEGYAQRRYDKLGVFLERQLRRPVELAFTEDLAQVVKPGTPTPGLVIGKQSLVTFDAERTRLNVRVIARLTGQDGRTDLYGMFVVRAGDPAKSIKDLKGRRICFGPKEEDEKHAAAIVALKANGIAVRGQLQTAPDCGSGGVAVLENKADAAVISSYALALLEGCDKIDKGALRVVGHTGRVPFITVFATGTVDADTERAVIDALLGVREQPALLKAMETKGFVRVSSWPDWRGPRRDGLSADVPDRLPAKVRFLWKTPLTGWGMSGVTVGGGAVIVADKSAGDKDDVWRCLDADTGRERWTLKYPAPDEMEHSNSPRATPVIKDGRAYLLGAFGHLHCVRLSNGEVIWKRDLAKDFGARPPYWGHAATPLIVGDKLIVAPGAKKASLVALNRFTGKLIWQTPGRQTAYSSPVLATLGGRRQIVTYDCISLGGWDPDTGNRLWEVLPELDGDFNVPTPIILGDRLFVTTENNGSRLYAFDRNGKIRPKPTAAFEGLAPDTSTPIVVDGMVFGCWDGQLFCLDARRGLKLLWQARDAAFEDYVTMIGGNGRVLIQGVGGQLMLVRARRDKYELISRPQLFDPERTEVWSHPALVGNRWYVRTHNAACCVLLD